MKINEVLKELNRYIKDNVDIYWALEEARALGYRIVKLHRSREHDVSLVLLVVDYDEDLVKPLGVMVMLDLEKLRKTNTNTEQVKKVVKKFARSGDTFYAEGRNVIQVVLRTKSLKHALKMLDEISSNLKDLGVKVEDRFLGYSFMEEEI